MKRCPECRRDYYDDTLSFCLEDGTQLVQGSVPLGQTSGDEPATVILHTTDAVGDAPTRAQIHTTEQTAVLPSGIAYVPKKGFDKRLLAAAVVLALIVLGGFFGYRYFVGSKVSKPQPSSEQIKTQRLTGDGRSAEPVISPDGKFLVFLKLEGGKQSLWIKQIEANSSVNIVKPGEFDRFGGTTFSPDGNYVYFNGFKASYAGGIVYRVPTLGGTPIQFLSNARLVRFSRDGKQISYLRINRTADSTSLYIASSDGNNEREVITRTGDKAFYSPADWSPDGKFLAVGVIDDSLAPAPNFMIYLVSVADGSATEFGKQRWEGIGGVVWHPSGDSLIVSVSANSFQDGQLWEVSYLSGEYRRLTNNLNGYNGVSITADGNSIVTGEQYTHSAVWVSPDTKPENAKAVMPASGFTGRISWTPDGRIVYVSDQSGDVELWIMNADGSDARALTNDKIYKLSPAVSPDGKYIVYTTSQDGGQLVRIDIGGGNPLRLTKINNSTEASFSPDGKSVLHYAYVNGESKILSVSIDGGEARQLTDYSSETPSYSKDGTKFACVLYDEKYGSGPKLGIVSADGGEPIKVLSLPSGTDSEYGLTWTPDDRGIVVTARSGEMQNLWMIPIDGGEPKQITNFDNPSVYGREYSRDGKRIAVVRGDFVTNAIMITGYR